MDSEDDGEVDSWGTWDGASRGVREDVVGGVGEDVARGAERVQEERERLSEVDREKCTRDVIDV